MFGIHKNTFQGNDQKTISALLMQIARAESDLEEARERVGSVYLDSELTENPNQAARAQEQAEAARKRLALLQCALTAAQSRKQAAEVAARAEETKSRWSRADYLARKRSELAKKLDRHAEVFAKVYQELCETTAEMYAVAPATDGSRHTSSLSIQSLDNAIRCTLRHHGVPWAAPGETAGVAPSSVLGFVRTSNGRILNLKEVANG